MLRHIFLVDVREQGQNHKVVSTHTHTHDPTSISNSPLQTRLPSFGRGLRRTRRSWGRAWTLSAGAAGRAPETVRNHLKGAECEANLLQWNKHARHTQTHEAALEWRTNQQTNKHVINPHTCCNTVRAVPVELLLLSYLCRAFYQLLDYLTDNRSSHRVTR